MVAATTTSFPETVTDWTGSFRDMKEGWRKRKRSCQSGGGGGSGCHLEEIGSKELNSMGFERWRWVSAGRRRA